MFTPKIITNDAENEAALAAYDACLDQRNEVIDGKEDLHALLGSLIDSYEEKRRGPATITSAFVLECTMQAKGWTQARLGQVVGSASLVSEVLSGKRDLTPAVIEKLAREGMPIRLLTSFIPIKHRKLLAKFEKTPAPRATRSARPVKGPKQKA